MSMIPILFLGGVVIVILLLVGIVVEIRGEKSLLDDRIDHYAEEEAFESEIVEEEQPSRLTRWIDERLQGSKWGDKIATSLAQANLKLRPAEYVALMVILAIGGGVVAWYFGKKSPISAGIGVIVGLLFPGFYVRRQQGQRLKAFASQLPDMLNLVVNGLRAGYSTVQALEAVSSELPPPISEEFHRVVQEMQLGLPMDEALANLHRRIPSDDLDLINTAINVQREVGGNLAEILDTISYTIRERIRIKGEIQVLVSQVMYSGRFLSALPFILASILWFINQDYMLEFFKPENLVCGIVMLSIAATLVGLGYFVMTKIADIEI